MPFMGLAQDLYMSVEAKTATCYLKPSDSGKLFTDRGVGADIVFYLPAVADIPTGWNAWFYATDATYTFTVSALSTNLIVFNNAAATSIGFATASEIIGGGFRVVFDGTSYLVFVHLAAEAQTLTIA
jgi:hypothetical protein